MARHFSALLLFVLLGCSIATFANAKAVGKNSGCFRAAVLDHVQQTDPTEPDNVLRNIELNLKQYETAAALAKQNDADIIVFAEDGIIYNVDTRELAFKYAPTLPNTNNQTLCQSAEKGIAQRLSCLAQKHSMWIGAHIMDKQPCSAFGLDKSDKKCPKDGQFVFNTAVLFNRQGTMVAKYHKMHLFSKVGLDTPPKAEFVVVDTELGRLGLQVCFDMIFNKPGHVLAEEAKVDTMVFPTWWFDEAPFLFASQYQMAWSFGNKVNLLASNIHKVELGSRGSGIYAGARPEFSNGVFNDGIAHLIIANVPIKPRSNDHCEFDSKTLVVPQQVPVVNKSGISWYLSMQQTGVKMTKLEPTKTSASVCSEGVCCQVEYKLETSGEENFFLIAGNRTRTFPYQWAEEMCAVVQCSDQDCSQFWNESGEIQGRFTTATLSGNFSPDTAVYPSVAGEGHRPLHPTNLWTFSPVNHTNYQIRLSNPAKLATLGLYGRAYSRDPLDQQ